MTMPELIGNGVPYYEPGSPVVELYPGGEVLAGPMPGEQDLVEEMPPEVPELSPEAILPSPETAPPAEVPPEPGLAAPSPQEAKPTPSELAFAARSWLTAPSLLGLPRWVILGASGFLGWKLGRRDKR